MVKTYNQLLPCPSEPWLPGGEAGEFRRTWLTTLTYAPCGGNSHPCFHSCSYRPTPQCQRGLPHVPTGSNNLLLSLRYVSLLGKVPLLILTRQIPSSWSWPPL